MAGYGDNEGFAAYAEAAGHVLTDGTTDQQITTARQRGALAIDRYEPRFSGRRTGGFLQERAWPRSGAAGADGEAIPNDVVPAAIIAASYEAAFLELLTPNSLMPVVTAAQSVRREKIGAIEVEYNPVASLGEAAAAARPVSTAVEVLLQPFLQPVLPSILVV